MLYPPGEYLDKWVSGEAKAKRLYLKDWHFLLHGDPPPHPPSEKGSGRDDNLSHPPSEEARSGGGGSRPHQPGEEDSGEGLGEGEEGAQRPLYVVPDPLADDWLNAW